MKRRKRKTTENDNEQTSRRRWIQAVNRSHVMNDEGRAKKEGTAGTVVRICSYNILSERAAEKYKHELYRNKSSEEMNFARRLNKIQREIKETDSDLICLQEVDFFRIKEISDGIGNEYEYRFARKGKGKTDGCAIFWKREKFTLKKYVSVSERCFGCFGLICALKSLKENDDVFVVGNAHLLFAPKNGFVKLAQLQKFMNTIETVRRKMKCAAAKLIAIDGNFLPNSALYKVMTEASSGFRKESCNRRNMGGYLNDDDDMIADDDDEENLNLKSWDPSFVAEESYENVFNEEGIARLKYPKTSVMQSAYKIAMQNEPIFTSLHQKFCGTTDYIFFDEEVLKVHRVLETPKINKGHTLPNARYPSDHVSLVAEFNRV